MKRLMLMILVFSVLTVMSNKGFGYTSLLNLGPEELVEAGGVDVKVPGYSVPSFVDWNNDGLKDLVIGEGGGYGDAKVRVYLNVGTESNPQFSYYFYAQSNGSDLTCPASGCLGCFPRLDYWDGDRLKDLIVGQADGTVKIFLNIGSDENPTFDGGTYMKVGNFASNLDVGGRATPITVDWDDDGRKDVIVGGLDGKIHLYINCGCGGSIPPRFLFSPTDGEFVKEDGLDLVVPSLRSSPVVLDLDGNGVKDLLTGNTEGQLVLYRNFGSHEKPIFSGYSLVESNGIPIDLPDKPRSRPFVCDWTNDGYLDVLVGAGDGMVHLYQGVPKIGDIDGNGNLDFADFSLFAAYWHKTGCGKCGGADFTYDGNVNIDDLLLFAFNWLAGESPVKASALEDFETGDFGKFPWEHSGAAAWTVTSWDKHSGAYSAEANSIDDGQKTTLQVTLACVSGNITFYRRVSSELGSDYLKFYIDGVERGKWSGEVDWVELSFPVESGIRTFTWTYSKDGSLSEGGDAAWIDDIVFPI